MYIRVHQDNKFVFVIVFVIIYVNMFTDLKFCIQIQNDVIKKII